MAGISGPVTNVNTSAHLSSPRGGRAGPPGTCCTVTHSRVPAKHDTRHHLKDETKNKSHCSTSCTHHDIQDGPDVAKTATLKQSCTGSSPVSSR